MKTTRVAFFLFGLAAGILLSAVGIKWVNKYSRPEAKSAAPSPRSSAPTLDQIQSSLPLPQFPILTASGSVIDVKRSSWQLRALDNSTVRFSDMTGKILFINSWGTGCQPCVAEMPSIQALCDSLKSDQVAFLVYSAENIDTLRTFAKRKGWRLPIFQSISGLPAKFDTKVWPTTFILNRTGTIVYAEAGGCRWNDPSVIKFIRGLDR